MYQYSSFTFIGQQPMTRVFISSRLVELHCEDRSASYPGI